MRFCSILGLLSFLIISCNQKSKIETDSTIPPKVEILPLNKHSQFDSSRIAIIEFDQTDNWPIDSSYKPVQLTKTELILIDSLFNICIHDYNESLPNDKKADFRINFQKYKYNRQYVAVINSNGEKEIWINGFCDLIDRNKNWKKEIIRVMDGGNCYFNLKINLATMKCLDLSVNGYA